MGIRSFPTHACSLNFIFDDDMVEQTDHKHNSFRCDDAARLAADAQARAFATGRESQALHTSVPWHVISE